MKILLVNKFLYPKGGAETYVFKLGKHLKSKGHEVEYFGMEHPSNIVGNNANAYVSSIDLGKTKFSNIFAPLRIIYSYEARKKIRKVLDDFKPDVIHLNNIHYYLTPSILLEIHKYSKDTNHKVRIIYTAHDYQLVCPSHGLFDSNLIPCEKCLSGNYKNCFKTKCLKNSRLKSLIGTLDAYFWKHSKAYSYVDCYICPSLFLKSKMDTQKRFKNKTITIHNFIDESESIAIEKEDYILEFGKLCRDKGTATLLEVCKLLPEIKFVFAGYGPLESEIEKVPNAEFVGFKTGKELETLIRKAAISICPSECYENCPFTVLESQLYLTPVIGSNMGGIPELIEQGRTGEVFEAGNVKELANKIKELWYNKEKLKKYTENCKTLNFETKESYYEKLIKIYRG